MPDDKSEKYELGRINASPTKNSGRGQSDKGDGIISHKGEPMFTVDVKEYEKGYRLTEANWGKVALDAHKNSGTRPLLKVVLNKEEPKTRLVVMDEKMFNMIMEVYNEFG